MLEYFLIGVTVIMHASIVLLRTFILPPCEGTTDDFSVFFTEAPVRKVDKPFAQIIRRVGPRWNSLETSELSVYLIYEGISDEQVMNRLGTPAQFQSPDDSNRLCVILSYLGSPAGWSLLNIPQGYDEQKISAGFGLYRGKWMRMVVEHEKEEAQEEQVHLHSPELKGASKKSYLLVAPKVDLSS